MGRFIAYRILLSGSFVFNTVFLLLVLERSPMITNSKTNDLLTIQTFVRDSANCSEVNPLQASANLHNFELEQETVEEFMKRVEERMKQRRLTITNTCKTLDFYNEQIHNLRLLPAKTYHLMYCYIPKAGCTHMKFLIMALNGLSNLTYSTVHEEAKKMLYYGGKPPMNEELKHALKVILVRHPYERLVSSYLDKINSRKERVFYARSQNIRKRYGNSTRVKEVGETADFGEFVDYLSEVNRAPISGGTEAHWNTYNYICHPCHVQYDVIAHLETIEEDVRYMLRLIQAPPNLAYNRGYSVEGKSKTQENLVKRYFKKLTTIQKMKLYKAYKIDFDLFNYDLDDL